MIRDQLIHSLGARSAYDVLVKQQKRFNRILFAANLELDPTNNVTLRREAERIKRILERRMPTTLVFVKTPEDLEGALRDFDPANTLVFNWAEDIPGYVAGPSSAMQIVEQNGFAHTASPAATQRLITNRAAMYRLTKQMDIPIPQFMQVFSPPDVELWEGKWPALVRPNEQHGSLGLFRVKDTSEAERKVEELFVRFDPPATIIEYISPAREFSVGMWSDGRTIEAFPILERNFKGQSDDILDEADKDPAKALPDMVARNLPAAVEAKMVEGSKQIFRRFGIKIYGRVDWRLRRRSLDPVMIDVNPEPDCSHDSSLADMVVQSGRMTWPELILGIVDRTITYYSARPSIQKSSIYTWEQY